MFFTPWIFFLNFGLASVFQLSMTNFLPNLIDLDFYNADLLPKNSTIFSLAQAQTQENSTSSKRPTPPPRIPPNRVKPGGGLDFARQSCGANSASVTALIPVNNPVLTTQPYPSFLFYIPDTPAAISYGEFSLFTADEKQKIYKIKVNFERTPGIIKIDLPTSPQYALEEATYYHWYFKVYCQDSAVVRRSLNVDGWVQRIPMTPAIKSQIEATPTAVWYDAISNIAENLMASPQNLLFRERWNAFLQHINLEHLADYPIIDVSKKQVGKK